MSLCVFCLSRLRAPTAQTRTLSVSISATNHFPWRTSRPSSDVKARSFHSTPSSSKSVVKKPTKPIANFKPKTPGLRESRAAKLHKTKRVVSGLPQPGQRREERRRIVLSNTNALPVRDMQNLTEENMSNPANIGQVLGFDSPLIDPLRAAEAFKRTQNWKWYNRPGTLIRPESVQIAEMIQGVNPKSKESQTFRVIFSGERGTGKSLMLLQAQAMALMKGWIVISIPEAQDFINAHSSYSPLANTSPQAYTQPHLLSTLLRRISNTNPETLSTLRLSQEHPRFPIPLQSNISLQQLCTLGAEDPTLAFHTWRAFWRELTNPKAPRPPILFTVDSINHWMRSSAYRDPDYNLIHAHQFQLISLFVSLLFKTQPVSAWNPVTQTQNEAALEPPILPHGGLVLTATSASNVQANPSLAFLLPYFHSLANTSKGSSTTAQTSLPQPSPYDIHDPRILHLCHACQSPPSPLGVGVGTGAEQQPEGGRLYVKELQGLSKDESRSLLEYAAKSGLLRRRIDEEFVSELWAMSGGGRVGELMKWGTRVRGL